VLCTGSRVFDEKFVIYDALDSLYMEAKAHLHILVGDCKTGADEHVRYWVEQRERQGWAVTLEVFEAQWLLFKPRRAAGPARNKRMVDAGADRGLAWYAPPPALNKGTRGCVKLARDAGIPVREYGLGLETPATPFGESQ
jgi:hypothetical protein